ncbi:MAG: hypothetical protein Kow0063_18410 [Anaerolineae bacterium]
MICQGINIDDMKTINMAFLARQRRRAKEKAAGTETISERIVAEPAMITLFRTHLRKGQP